MYQSVIVIGFAVPALAGLIMAEHLLLPSHDDGLNVAATEIVRGGHKLELQISKETCHFLKSQRFVDDVAFQAEKGSVEIEPATVQIDTTSGEVFLNGDPLSGSGREAIAQECQKLL